jgi:hypothetical protein
MLKHYAKQLKLEKQKAKYARIEYWRKKTDMSRMSNIQSG